MATPSQSTSKPARSPKSPKKNNDMSDSEVRQAIIKKHECNSRAQKIVERLIENPVTPEWFLYCLKFINQSHLDDIFEERAVIKQCGYPICLGIIDKVPRKQYEILARAKKVYDITERKKFCTNQCYEAAIFIKEQMLTSPLWMRDREEIPDFKLLTWTQHGKPGDEVDFGIPKIDEKDDFIPTQNFTEGALNEILDDDFDEIDRSTLPDYLKTLLKDDEKSIRLEAVEKIAKNLEECKIGNGLDKELELGDTEKIQKCNDEEKKEEIGDKNVSNNSDQTNEPTDSDVFGENCVSFNTKQIKKFVNDLNSSSNGQKAKEHLKNDNPIKEEIKCNAKKFENVKFSVEKHPKFRKHDEKRLNDVIARIKEKSEKEKLKKIQQTDYVHDEIKAKVLKLKPINVDTNTNALQQTVEYVEKFILEWITTRTAQFLFDHIHTNVDNDEITAKYNKIVKQLDILQIEDTRLDSDLTDKLSANVKKPLPDYESLKKQSQMLQIRVKCFFQGQIDVPAGENIEHLDSGNESETDGKQENGNCEHDDDFVVPLVEKDSQNLLRRRILFAYIYKTFPKIFSDLGMDVEAVRDDLQKLVSTFSLTAKNVIFQPVHLNLLSIYIIMMLGEKNHLIKEQLTEDHQKKYLTEVLKCYHLTPDHAQKFLSKIRNVK